MQFVPRSDRACERKCKKWNINTKAEKRKKKKHRRRCAFNHIRIFYIYFIFFLLFTFFYLFIFFLSFVFSFCLAQWHVESASLPFNAFPTSVLPPFNIKSYEWKCKAACSSPSTKRHRFVHLSFGTLLLRLCFLLFISVGFQCLCHSQPQSAFCVMPEGLSVVYLVLLCIFFFSSFLQWTLFAFYLIFLWLAFSSVSCYLLTVSLHRLFLLFLFCFFGRQAI